MIAAYYYPRSKRRPAIVKICQIVDGRSSELHYAVVDGAREARKVAASFNAKPWNF